MPNQPATTMVTSKGGLKGPTQLDIDTITKNLPCSSKNTTMPIINIEELVMQSDVNVIYYKNCKKQKPHYTQNLFTYFRYNMIYDKY